MAPSISEVSPLDLLRADSISRSDYFSAGFYPLNSLIQVAVLSAEDMGISDVRGDILPTRIIGNERVPTDVTKNGWVFDPEQGQVIQGKYIFGKETTVGKDELKFSLLGAQSPVTTPLNPTTPEETTIDESIAVVAIITIVAIAAALFYLKGYKK